MPLPQGFTKKDGGYTFEELEDLVRQSDESMAEALEIAKAEAALTDAEKAHYGTLSGQEKSDFLYAEAADRANVIKSAQEADPVIYTTKTGMEIRKSHGEVALTLAQEADRQGAQVRALAKASQTARINVFVKEELPHLPGTDEEKAEAVRAVESISDEAARDAALKMLKANNTALGEHATELGTSEEDDELLKMAGDRKEAEAKLEKATREIMKQNPGMEYFEAYEKAGEQDPQNLAKAMGV